jgi:hypothetical protein
MGSTHPFRQAVEAGDVDAVLRCLSLDAVLFSPVAFAPFEGDRAVGDVLRLVAETFEDFRYVDEVGDGPTTAFVFRARVGDREVHGLDLVHSSAEGLIDELTVMVRPLSAAVALAEAMGPKVAAAGLK